MNEYHIYEELGKGKKSVVYKGRKHKSIEYVAVKSVDRDQMDKVLHEVQVMYRLKHPNILRFFNWYETRNHIWLIFTPQLIIIDYSLLAPLIGWT